MINKKINNASPFKEEWIRKEDKEKYNKYYTKEKLLELKNNGSVGGKISQNNDT